MLLSDVRQQNIPDPLYIMLGLDYILKMLQH